MIKIIAGNNWYAVKTEIDKVVVEFLKTGNHLNIERFYGPDGTLADVQAALDSVSLFAEEKLVIVDGLSAHKDALEDLDKFFNQVSDTTTFLVVETDVDKRSSYYKSLKKQQSFSEYNELDEPSLVNWAISFVKDFDGEMNRIDARYLVNRVGLNQTNLEHELRKLVNYDPKITPQNIDLLTDPTPNTTIFNLVETAFAGYPERALNIYDQQRKLKVEPQAIFGMLVWQMHLVAVCAAAGDKSSNQIASETSLNNFTLSKAKNIASKMGSAKVRQYLDFLLNIERTSRRQTYNFDDAMKLAIMKLAY